MIRVEEVTDRDRGRIISFRDKYGYQQRARLLFRSQGGKLVAHIVQRRLKRGSSKEQPELVVIDPLEANWSD
jgi:hypothetical protein